MVRFHYAVFVDVLRLFQFDLEESDLGNELKNSDVVKERIRAKLDAAEAEFDSRTSNPWREHRVGRTGNPDTYEKLEGYGGTGNNTPINFYPSNMHIVPLDSSKDTLEVRTGRNSWKDITSDTDRWTADYDMGKISVYEGPGTGTLSFRRLGDWQYNARITYRYGALGGAPDRPGQTTLSAELSSGSTSTVAVDSIQRLPQGEFIFLVGGSEYLRADASGTDLDVKERGMRGTSDVTHSSGTVVHFCPIDIREGVASKAAMELLRQDDTLDILVETGDTLQVNERIQELRKNWNNAMRRVEGTFKSG